MGLCSPGFRQLLLSGIRNLCELKDGASSRTSLRDFALGTFVNWLWSSIIILLKG